MQDTQAAISSAVTPVVMISANAILIGAINSKHQSMSDRLRNLTGEWRNPATGDARRRCVAAQIRLLDERIRWVTGAHIVLFVATAFFIATVILLAALPRLEIMSGAPLTLLIAGVSLMLVGIVLELLDLAKARATLRIELEDIG